jgi:Fic family protein
MVFEERNEYYRQIRNAQECGDVDCFVRFMLKQIRRSLWNLWENSLRVPNTSADRIAIAKQSLGTGTFSRKNYLRLFKTISQPTASRDLSMGVAAGFLEREGDRRTTVYRFV